MNPGKFVEQIIEETKNKLFRIKQAQEKSQAKFALALNLQEQSKNLTRELIEDIISGQSTTGNPAKDWCLANYTDIETADKDIISILSNIDDLENKFKDHVGDLIWIISVGPTPFGDFVESHLLGRIQFERFVISKRSCDREIQDQLCEFPIKNFVMQSGVGNARHKAELNLALCLGLINSAETLFINIAKLNTACERMPKRLVIDLPVTIEVERSWLEIVIGEQNICNWINTFNTGLFSENYQEIFHNMKKALLEAENS